MLYFGVVMAATLKLSSVLGSPGAAMWIILAAMILLPVAVRRLKLAYVRLRAGGAA
jgi:hypothetical protein